MTLKKVLFLGSGDYQSRIIKELESKSCVVIQTDEKIFEIDKSIDLVLTDPPYNINLKPQRKKTVAIANDNMTQKDFIIFLNTYFSECKRILKNDTFLITFL